MAYHHLAKFSNHKSKFSNVFSLSLDQARPRDKRVK